MSPGPHNLTGPEMAECLWGPDWQSPLALVAGVNVRTVQRWAAHGVWERSPQDEPAPLKSTPMPADVRAWLLARLEALPIGQRRVYGAMLRAAVRHIPGPLTTPPADEDMEAMALVARDVARGDLPRRP